MAQHRRITMVRDALGIRDLQDWSKHSPADVLAIEGVGPQTLDEVRYWLAARGMTLANDRTPEYWSLLGGRLQIGTRMADGERYVTSPFTILIDTQEQIPWTFHGLRSHRRGKRLPLIVPTIKQKLGKFHGDYTIQGLEEMVSIERKAPDDARSSLLDYREKRENLRETLRCLTGMRYAAIVIECTFGQLLGGVEARGRKTEEEIARTLYQTVIAWQQDLRVPWLFCDSRRLAEVTAYRILERAFRKLTKPKIGRDRKRDELDLV